MTDAAQEDDLLAALGSLWRAALIQAWGFGAAEAAIENGSHVKFQHCGLMLRP